MLDRATAEGTSTRADATFAWIDASTRFWTGGATADDLEEARKVALETGDPYAQLLDESYLALCLLDEDEPEEARRWVDAAFTTAEEHGLTSFGYLAAAHVVLACLARLVLAEAQHSAGDRASARDVLHLVRQDPEPLGTTGVLGERLQVAERQLRLQQKPIAARRFDQPLEDLTDREIALLRLLPGESTQRELGDALHMSFNTVKSYNRQIYRKLGVSSRDEAVKSARAAGLL